MLRFLWLLPALIGSASAETLVITASECAHVVEHRPSADIAYVPGLDSRGNKVASADVDGGAVLRMPDDIVIDIELDLNRRLGLPTGPNAYDADVEISTVRYRDGALSFNGQPLRNEARAALIRACRDHLRSQRCR